MNPLADGYYETRCKWCGGSAHSKDGSCPVLDHETIVPVPLAMPERMNAKLRAARTWMEAQKIHQLGTEHLTQKPYSIPALLRKQAG